MTRLSEIRSKKPQNRKITMNKQAHRGAQRVEIGAKCRAGKCSRCTVQDCSHPCHTREFTSWDQADAHRVTTGRPLTYSNGRYLVLLALCLAASGCAALRDYSQACGPEIRANGELTCPTRPVTQR